MTHEEQKKMIEELRDYTHRMTRTEEEAFQMYVRYVVNRVRRI
jgi:hypothetical protein